MPDNNQNLSSDFQRGERRHLSPRRNNITQTIQIGSYNFTYSIGYYDNDDIGEIFIECDNMEKKDPQMTASLNFLSIAISLGLQYGVPLEVFLKQFLFAKTEPCGIVKGHPNIKMATSYIDAIFRDLAIQKLGRWDLAQVKPEDFINSGNSNITIPNVDNHQVEFPFLKEEERA